MNVQRYTIPGGDRGIRKTVQHMRGLVQDALRQPLPVETADAIVAPYCCGAERVQAIRDYLLAHVAFMPDPVGHELLRTPDYLLHQIQAEGVAYGDCDDVATLGATLGMATGYPARFVLLGFHPQAPFSHVFTELDTPSGWAELDTTAPAQFPPGLAVHKVERINV